ncbi:MAG: RsmD family RNA methyltransferase [Alistipes sp.]|nr:RsmD family RNA methyltransferase [Alistipes sp.]
MTQAELDILLREEVRQAIKENMERDPLRIALDGKLPYAREVATQVKYLQRARRKLPRLYAACGIIPQRAFEQSSSEECASAKRIGGESLLDLTCGLGMDAAALAGRFRRVVALERDQVLAAVTKENMRRMGIENVEVVNTSAEEYLVHCEEHFDWIYVDPDRRTDKGERVFKLEDCSPNVLALMPHIKRVGEHLAIKNSPLFDVEEAFRLFPDGSVEVVSLHDECKEVMIYLGGGEPTLSATAVGRGRVEFRRAELATVVAPEKFAKDEYHYLVIPDVSLQKARIVANALQGVADVWSNNSFGFARELPEGVLGRVERVERIEIFDIKSLKRELKGKGVDIVLRDFPMGVDELRKRTASRSGNEKRIALTRIAGKSYTIYLA